MKCKLSVIIPVYNEENIVERNINKVVSKLRKMNLRWELVLVNDGSRDGTLSVIKNKFSGCNHIRIINFKINKGKGAAIRKGVERSRGDFIIFMDVDLATPLTYLDRMLIELEKRCDVVVGSRRLKESKILKHQPFYREFLGMGFTFITKKILGINTSDFTCGFKGFRKEVAKEIFSKGRINRWAFDAEVLFLATILGHKICEIPVGWRDRGETRVRLWRDLPRSLYEIIKIKLEYITGQYER